MEKRRNETQALVFSAILLAMALVVNLILRVPGPIRLSLGNPFLRLIAILFGPIYGGISGLLLDVISLMIKGEGAIIISLTLVEVAKGVFIGLFWQWLKNLPLKAAEIAYVIFWIIPLIFAVVGVGTMFLPETNEFYQRLMGVDENMYAYIFIILGLCIMNIIVYVFGKRAYEKETGFKDFRVFLILMLVIGLPCLVGTTVNTAILKAKFFTDSDKSFLIMLIPRIITEFILTVYSAYIVTFMLRLYNRMAKATN